MHLPTRATPPSTHSHSLKRVSVLTACAAVPEPGQDLAQSTLPSNLVSSFGAGPIAALPLSPPLASKRWIPFPTVGSPRSELFDATRL
ncbi:hypothetical protein LY78DRAFT_655885, partial [Colletotrichum sublineola]